jgi:hypothetical protein
MFKDFTQGLAGEELRIIKQLQINLYEAHNVANNIEDNNIQALHHNSYGIMSKNEDGGWIDVTQFQQKNNIALMKMEEFRYRCDSCKKLFTCEIGWREHAERMDSCGKKCICDVF